ncbi:uncharacterized protein LOC111371770 [Olea europaea var. sylvestris]|uniref:uncharacterized protein LOC111371770 n=1 Tax=Olea europaea var. sylvestris TaxID=158386 RepID=UPI000C1D436D|nr:uncharacterized protein LOC111371770 [Olea europaea var. sylvestris]
MEFNCTCDTHLSLMEFAYNNNYYSSIEMGHFEALYVRKCRTKICWDDTSKRKLIGPELVQITLENMKFIREKLKPKQDRKKSCEDRCGKDLEFVVGDKYIANHSHVLESQPVQLEENLTYIEKSMRILNRKMQKQRSKTISLANVLWKNQTAEEVTWEHENQKRTQILIYSLPSQLPVEF